MISSIDFAKGALALTGRNIPGNMSGRNISHWSTHLAMTGTLIGAIAFVSGIALDSIVVAALGGMLFVTNGISAYYLKKFSVFNSIDEVIHALAETIHELYQQIVGLHAQIGALGPSTQRLSDERIKIEARLKESNETIARLEKVEKQFAETNKKFTKLANIYGPLKDAVDNFIRNVSELKQNEIDLTLLAKAVKDLANERTRLEGSIKAIDDGTKALDTQGNKIKDLSVRLGSLLDAWNGDFEDLKTQITKLETENDQLQAQLTSLTLENTKLEGLITRAEAVRVNLGVQMRALIEQLNAKR